MEVTSEMSHHDTKISKIFKFIKFLLFILVKYLLLKNHIKENSSNSLIQSIEDFILTKFFQNIVIHVHRVNALLNTNGRKKLINHIQMNNKQIYILNLLVHCTLFEKIYAIFLYDKCVTRIKRRNE